MSVRGRSRSPWKLVRGTEGEGATAGVRVFFYLEDRERTLESPTDKLLLSVTAFADELEREKARQRTYDAMRRKAQAAHVTGGRVFGYPNVEVFTDIVDANGRPQRSHVEREIDESEAPTVRRIFDLCAAGHGMRAIAAMLNDEYAPSPRAQQGRPKRVGAVVGARSADAGFVSWASRVEQNAQA